MKSHAKMSKENNALTEDKNSKGLTPSDVINGLRIAHLQMQKTVLENPIRFKILTVLTERETITWTDMQNELHINPNMIQYHTNYLMDKGLIEKTTPGFRLTRAGRAIMTMSLEDMIETAKLGVEITREHSKRLSDSKHHGDNGEEVMAMKKKKRKI